MSDSKIYISFLGAREAGLSYAKTDSASKYPWPIKPFYHTNKGITRGTFEAYGPILGYEPTYDLFLEMPEWIFEGIVDGYWKTAGANKINSQAVANLVFQALWGGGHKYLCERIQEYFKPALRVNGHMDEATAARINVLCGNKANELAFTQYVHDKRLQYLRSLKAYKANGKGWESRMEKLKAFNIQLITGKV